VTIHHIDEGIDTGEICFQREIKFTQDENNFKKTQERLLLEIETLFKLNYESIIQGDYKTRKQNKTFTYHKKSDLPISIKWDEDIEECLKRLGK